MTDRAGRQDSTRRGAGDGQDVPRTRGGWAPVGTAAARRAKHDESATQRGRAARAEIVRAARVVFERDGFLGARVDDIVAEAGVARGSFYTYFPSKTEVFREIAADVADQIRAAVRRASTDTGDDYQALEESNLRYLAVYRANSSMFALIEQVATVDPEIHRLRLAGRRAHVERVARTIGRWQASGLADPTIDPTATAGALVSMLSNFAYWWIAGGDTYDERVASTTLTRIWARAVGLERRA